MPINTPTGYLDITNATLRGSKIVTTGYVGIANANPTNHLSIGSNLHINDTHSNVLQISGNINAASVVLGGITIAPTFDLEVITNTGNTTPNTLEFNNAATAFVTTANATIGDTLTASKFVGDGSGISAIQSSNVTDFASNVSRISALETNLDDNSARITDLSSNLSDNSARITDLSSNLSDNSSRITDLSSNLSDNSSRITTLESGDISISGDKTFTGDIIFESNVHMNGNVLVANTINMTVSDPIIELGSNNLGTNDLGIIMTRPNNNSNVAVVFDESVDILRMGYTLNGASDSIIDLDSNALAVSVQGGLTVGSNLEVGTANLFVDTTTGKVSIGAATPQYKLDVDGGTTEGDGDVMLRLMGGGNMAGKLIFGRTGTADLRSHAIECKNNVNTAAGNFMKFLVHDGGNTPPHETRTTVMTLQGDGNVGIGLSNPSHKLDVSGDINFTGSLLQNGAAFQGSKWTTSGSNIYRPSGSVGIGTNSPTVSLHTKGEAMIGTSADNFQTELKSLYFIRGANRNNAGTGDRHHYISTMTDGTAGGGDGNKMLFYIDDSSTTNGTSHVNPLTLNGSGNVGIGVASPSKKLHVNGTMQITDNIVHDGEGGDYTYFGFPSAYTFSVTCSGTERLRVNSGGVQGQAFVSLGDGNTEMHFPASDTIAWNTGGYERMRIDSSGRVGIGTTNQTSINPTRKFELGMNYGHLAGYLDTYLQSGVVAGMVLGVKDYTGTQVDTLYISDSGYVGIGTTNPTRKFELGMNSGHLAGYIDTYVQSGVVAGMILGVKQYNGTQMDTMYINDSGYAGVRTNRPQGNLHVSDGNGTTNTNPSHTPPLYVTGNIGGQGTGSEFRHFNQSQGIGIGYNSVYATGYASNQEINIISRGTSNTNIKLYAVYSDDRLKTNEEYITNATDTLMKLKPQVYDKHDEINVILDNPIREAGLMAQDIYYDAPELRYLVSARNKGIDAEPVNIPQERPFIDDDPTNDPDYSGWGTASASVAYIQLVPYLIKSNQELKLKNDALEARIAALESA